MKLVIDTADLLANPTNYFVTYLDPINCTISFDTWDRYRRLAADGMVKMCDSASDEGGEGFSSGAMAALSILMEKPEIVPMDIRLEVEERLFEVAVDILDATIAHKDSTDKLYGDGTMTLVAKPLFGSFARALESVGHSDESLEREVISKYFSKAGKADTQSDSSEAKETCNCCN